MNPHLLTLTIGLAYIVLFGGLSLIRREGLSLQFAIEVVVISAIIEAVAIAAGWTVNPIFYLIAVYLVSMRVRLLVDVANLLSNRGRQRDAINLLHFSLGLFPDKSSQLVVMVNMGIVQLRRQNPESALEIFRQVLEEGEEGGLGIKYEAACRYNYGLALQRTGKTAQAVREFNEVTVIYPTSIFSRAAENALEKHRKGSGSELRLEDPGQESSPQESSEGE